MGRPAKPVDESTYAGRFAARLRKLRENAGLTGEEMADAITKAGYKCPKRTYYDWEACESQPPMNALPFIAQALQIQIRTIFPNF